MQQDTSRYNKGISVVEIVIASSVLLLAIVPIFGSFAVSLKSTLVNIPFVQGAFLLEEGNEALINMRDWGWASNIDTLTNGTTYRLSYLDGRWQATTTNSFVDGEFDRSFTLSAVNRDSGNNVVSTGGSLDTGTRKVTVSISWREGNATTTKTMESYISNVFSN